MGEGGGGEWPGAQKHNDCVHHFLFVLNGNA